MKTTGAAWAWDTLTSMGTEVVFGIPGGAILPLCDAMVNRAHEVPLVVTRNEAAAVHAADGYARASGKPGVVIVTSGPGGSNALTGLVTAMTDSTPLVVIIGQVPMALIGTDAFQESDLFAMTMPVVKHSWRITRVEDVGPILREAYAAAQSGRPGPVVVEFPKNVQFDAVDVQEDPEKAAMPSKSYRSNALTWSRIQAQMKKAQRPLLYIGGGVTMSDTTPLIVELAERYDCPVVTTLMGVGAFPGSHPLLLGMVGMHGTWTSNQAMQASDLVIALGVRFDDRVTGKLDEFAPHAHIIHVEVDPAEIGKLVRPDIAIQGDLREVMPDFVRHAPQKAHDLWRKELEDWQQNH
ncbi:MAG: thiamine pyrophosphate-binding protein, partial [Firmicutes bacterium]|nr:thiamine pyrophosphate-binding protein [Bacillota bacterium]